MREFKSWQDFRTFELNVKKRNRYILDPASKEFLETLLSTAAERIETIQEGHFVWRAQLGHDWKKIFQDGEYIDDEPVPYPDERMKPLKDRANGGRANPKGIPYLYVATNRDTALAEIRPWIGSLISAGQLKINRPLRVVNCTIHTEEKLLISLVGEPDPKIREEVVWRDIDRAFARPVTPVDHIDDYAPTQIIAEFFKVNRLDGIAYRSSLGPGHNIVFFDLDAADLTHHCFIIEVKDITFEFEQK